MKSNWSPSCFLFLCVLLIFWLLNCSIDVDAELVKEQRIYERIWLPVLALCSFRISTKVTKRSWKYHIVLTYILNPHGNFLSKSLEISRSAAFATRLTSRFMHFINNRWNLIDVQISRFKSRLILRNHNCLPLLRQ